MALDRVSTIRDRLLPPYNPVHEAALWVQRFEWWDKHVVPATRCEGAGYREPRY
jgi:hypothetical protein